MGGEKLSRRAFKVVKLSAVTRVEVGLAVTGQPESVAPVPYHRLHDLWRGVGAAGPANKQPNPR